MTTMTQHDDEKFLARFIEPMRAAGESEDVSAAADRFRASLPETATRRSDFRRPRFAALAATLIGMAVFGPLWFSGGGGTAFPRCSSGFPATTRSTSARGSSAKRT